MARGWNRQQRGCDFEGCDRPHRSNGYCVYHWMRGFGSETEALPTPVARMNETVWNRGATWNVALPAVTRGVVTQPHTDQPRYAAQNERDGYQRDPAMRAWLFYDAPWATEQLDEAAD